MQPPWHHAIALASCDRLGIMRLPWHHAIALASCDCPGITQASYTPLLLSAVKVHTKEAPEAGQEFVEDAALFVEAGAMEALLRAMRLGSGSGGSGSGSGLGSGFELGFCSDQVRTELRLGSVWALR